MINILGCLAEIHDEVGSNQFIVDDLDNDYDDSVILALVQTGMIEDTDGKMSITEEAIAMIKATF